LSGKSCRFAVVKPAEWESPWVGEAEQNIRNCFKALREAAAAGFVVLFLDEVESIGRIRGNVVGFHADRSLAALLAELDGFEGRDRIAVIAASNRKDLMDPALLARLSDCEIHVQRPDMEAARAIFAIYLAETLPYSPNGSAAPTTRRELIDTAVSRWYAPNADNHICTLRFRDGKERKIAARELSSGRTFEQVCRTARWNAYKRHVAGGPSGLCTDDINDAISDAFDRLASTLTASNVHAHLDDMPQDVDVVAVQPATRRVARPHAFLTTPETSDLPSAGRGARGDRSTP
jgi:SpoVK/Ycf46/Vps4 family AAA+-type ATPase